MSNLEFVKDLLMETRRKQITWHNFDTIPYGTISPLRGEFEQVYCVEHNINIVLIAKNLPACPAENGAYTLVLADWDIKEVSRIDQRNLFLDHQRAITSADESALERLYRLAARNAAGIDRLMERMVGQI